MKTFWSPVTESNRRPSPYHACRFRLAATLWVVLRHVRATGLSGWVRLRLPWSEGVVTCFVTDLRTRSNMEHGRMTVRVGGGLFREIGSVVIATPGNDGWPG